MKKLPMVEADNLDNDLDLAIQAVEAFGYKATPITPEMLLEEIYKVLEEQYGVEGSIMREAICAETIAKALEKMEAKP
jgi:hypothetical protein